MSYVDELLAMKSPPPRRKRPEPPKPSAEVVAMPQGAALVIAKEDRTRAGELLTAAEWNRRGRRLREQEAQEEELAQPRRPVGYEAAGERFNEAYYREIEEARE